MFSFSLSSFLLLFSLSFSSCLFSPPFDDRSLQGPSPLMRGRLTRSVVDPAAALLRNASRSLAVMVRQKNQKKKEKKKSSKGCAEPAFPKPANFLGEIAFFCQNRPFRAGPEGGGGPGVGGSGGIFRGGSKTPKNGKKSSFSACPIGNFQSKRCFSI